MTYADEFHHAAANSYQELLAYYQPGILLGLTATPDRMDGKDILKYFDGRTASKMLLGEAIDRNLLSTFQYFGITDEIDYRKCKWTRGRYDTSELEKIYTADIKRCALVLNSVQKYVADMLYYTFYKKYPQKMGFANIDEGIGHVLAEEFVKDEVLQILKYKRAHVGFVSGSNEYSFTCPLDLHCQYN